MPKSYRFVVTGRVQGVFFRQSTKQRADELGLQGWVCNRNDGAVEGTVHGADAAALDAFRDWLQRGPARAQVQEVRWETTGDDPVTGFSVRRSEDLR